MNAAIVILERAERDALRAIEGCRAEVEQAKTALKEAEDGEMRMAKRLGEVRAALAQIRTVVTEDDAVAA